MSTHNIGFYEDFTKKLYEDLTKIIFQLSSNTFLISSYGFITFILSTGMTKQHIDRYPAETRISLD